jgi:hypothetical protein
MESLAAGDLPDAQTDYRMCMLPCPGYRGVVRVGAWKSARREEKPMSEPAFASGETVNAVGALPVGAAAHG